MNKCPKCGYEWPDKKRASGGKARWRGMSKKARSAAARKAAKARWAKSGNDGTQRRLPPPLSNDNTKNENGGSRSLE